MVINLKQSNNDGATVFSSVQSKHPVRRMLDRLLGTLFLPVSRTMHCLCLNLGTSSNISTSRPTSTPSAFEVFTVNAIYKFPTYLVTQVSK